MDSRRSELNSTTKAEENLFATELSSIEQCEDHLSSGSRTSTGSSRRNSVLPDWLDRPGAPEAVEVGADLRNRYDQLRVELDTRTDDGAQLLQKVLRYEAEYDKLKDWLTQERATITSLSPLTITCSEIRQQLKEVEVIRGGVCVCVESCDLWRASHMTYMTCGNISMTRGSMTGVARFPTHAIVFLF